MRYVAHKIDEDNHEIIHINKMEEYQWIYQQY